MELIPVFLGLIIAVALYLHFMSKLHTKEDKLKNADIEVENNENDTESDDKTKEVKETKEGLRIRFCPLCKAELAKHESLYAEMYEGEIRPKVIIHGCKHCYIPSKQKTNFDSNNIESEK